MNALDLVFLVAAAMAALGGWRFGFLRRVAGWAGLVLGVVVASRLLPVLFATPDTPSPGDLIRTLLVMLAGATLGQWLGHLIGTRVKRMISVDSFHLLDSAGGTLLGVVGVVLTAWMVIPTMVQISGWPADAARGSVVAARLTRALGTPPDVLSGVGRSLGVAGLEDALTNIRDLNIDPTAPNDSVLTDDVVAVVRPSVVRIAGPACGRTQSGSGFVIAPGVVVTNAHVVAGTESTNITGDGGLDLDASIRYLDLRNDIAVLSVPGLDRAPLALVDQDEGDLGAILGYPGGGSLKVQAYQVAAVTTATARDIYDQGSFSRRIAILGSRIGPGDSGGPLVTPDGTVAGMAFGIAPDRAETAYAIPADLLRGVVDDMSPVPLDSGRCRAA